MNIEIHESVLRLTQAKEEFLVKLCVINNITITELAKLVTFVEVQNNANLPDKIKPIQEFTIRVEYNGHGQVIRREYLCWTKSLL